MRSRVLLVHSGGFTSRQWRRLGEDLAAGYEVLMPDLIGYGAKRRWPVGEPFHFKLDVDRLATMIEGEPVHLVGHSYGGLLVMQLALGRQVRSISVYEPVTFGVLGEADADARASIEQLGRYVPDAAGIDEAWLRGFVDWWQGDGAWVRLAPDTQQSFRDVGWKLSEEVRTLAANRTSAAQYATVTAPVLVLGGARSQPVERRVIERLAAALPNATLRVFPELGHMGPITHGPQVNAAIAAHVRAN